MAIQDVLATLVLSALLGLAVYNHEKIKQSKEQKRAQLKENFWNPMKLKKYPNEPIRKMVSEHIKLITPKQYEEWLYKNFNLETLQAIQAELNTYADTWADETPDHINTLNHAIQLQKQLKLRRLLENEYKQIHNIHHFNHPPTFTYNTVQHSITVTEQNQHLELNPEYPGYEKIKELLNEINKQP